MLTIVAHITANPDSIELVKGELEKLIPITRSEEGCVQYDLHQDLERPAHFLFFEGWMSHDQWQQHMEAPHLAGFRAATEGHIDDFTVHQMKPVG
jgi:quinol monooxygenase YgiN